jgi:hypothetical protein
MADDSTFDLDAAGLRADGPELLAAIEVLARKLELSLPQSCFVARRRTRMFSKERAVEAIVVTLGTTHYGVEIHGDHVHADRRQEVRGVVIKRESLELADWIDALTAELREVAAGSAEARAALEKLMG